MSPALDKGMILEPTFSSAVARTPEDEPHAGTLLNISSPCRRPFAVLPGTWGHTKGLLHFSRSVGSVLHSDVLKT